MELLRDIKVAEEGRLDLDKEGKVMHSVLLFREERRDISCRVRSLSVGGGDIIFSDIY